jgi:putative protease
MKKIELLAPAGDLEKLKYAIAYGADAVYCGVPDFSLRVRINRFSKKDLAQAVEYVHKHKKKIYITLNIYAHNEHLEKIKAHIQYLKKLKVDAIIASDPGVISLVKKYWPEAEIHLSTQANATNFAAVDFWKKQGVKRIVLARELELVEIAEITKKVRGVELEYFVHGAMCMSYSGRCILSKWMTGRSANLGDCSQPCRWKYSLNGKSENLGVVDDQKRYGIDLEEDNHGTYFFNSYDMNLLGYLSELRAAGVVSFKIEGRAKSAYYLAVVTRAYRTVLDALEQGKTDKEVKAIIRKQKIELDNLVHRGYSTGFLLGKEPEHNFDNQNNLAKFQFVGEVKAVEDKFNILRVHNHISIDDKLEAIMPKENIELRIKKILDSGRKEVSIADGGHDKQYYFEFDRKLESGSLVRKLIQRVIPAEAGI